MAQQKKIKSLMRILILSLAIATTMQSFGQDPWVAPESVVNIKNPLANDAASIKTGSKIYQSMCWTCHGSEGKGDGPASAALTPKPGNLSAEAFQVQTDGAIFWKISEGRGAMSSYKGSLTTTQRWQLVNYLRTLKQ
jgi:mono/diheme cytochrome c family protein